ncbi:MAG: hypothetical protein MK135_00735, partial [Polyangiaceae bacterium]|nr:hypothetical protein [Polyangiaceae bacterium]
MSEEEQKVTGTNSQKREGLILVCDTSAEGERLSARLRSKGYKIVELPVQLLPARLLYEVPQLVICDADHHDALETIRRTKEATGVDFLVAALGQDELLLQGEAWQEVTEITWHRPVDLEKAFDALQSLLGPPPSSLRPTNGPHQSRAPLLVGSDTTTDSTSPIPHDESVGQHAVPGGFDSPWPTEPSNPSADPLAGVLLDELKPRHDRFQSFLPSELPPSRPLDELSDETKELLGSAAQRVAQTPLQASRPARLGQAVRDRGGVFNVRFTEALQIPLNDDADAKESDLAAERAAGSSPPPLTGSEVWDDKEESKQQAATALPLSLTEAPPHIALGKENSNPTRQLEEKVGGVDLLPRRGSAPPDNARTSPLPPAPLDEVKNWGELPPLDDLSDLLNSEVSGARDQREGQAPLGDDSLAKAAPLRPTKAPFSPEAMAEISMAEDVVRLGADEKTPLPQQRSKVAVEASDDRQAASTSPPPEQRHPTLEARAPEPITPSSEPRKIENQDRQNIRDKHRARQLLAQGIRQRNSVSIAQQTRGGIRRILLRDGDIVTITSSDESESLAQFLLSRGDISGPMLNSLGSVPLTGRHAGAAFIARGLLAQEELWPTLRAHAEWLLGKILVTNDPALLEEQIPHRLEDEPAVFGGSAGAEVLMEVGRRVISPEESFRGLGRGELVLSTGKHHFLLAESALPEPLRKQVAAQIGRTVFDLPDKNRELLTPLFLLELLDVVTTGLNTPTEEEQSSANISPSDEPSTNTSNLQASRSNATPRSEQPNPESFQEQSAAIDDDAFRSRTERRTELAHHSDYFEFLGISRSATSHEVQVAR